MVKGKLGPGSLKLWASSEVLPFPLFLSGIWSQHNRKLIHCTHTEEKRMFSEPSTGTIMLPEQARNLETGSYEVSARRKAASG